MKPGNGIHGGSASIETDKDLRLMTLLLEQIYKRGRMRAAKVMGVNYKTLARTMESSRLSERMRDALQHMLAAGGGSFAAEQRERFDALEQRIGEMQQRLETLQKDVRNGTKTGDAETQSDVRRSLNGFARELEEIAQRVARLEQAADGGKREMEPRAAGSGKERRQVYHSSYLGVGVISEEPHPGEEISYGPGMPLVEEWRRLNKERESGTKLAQAKTRERVMELEITMLGEYKLTLPPGTSPLDNFTRGAELDCAGGLC